MIKCIVKMFGLPSEITDLLEVEVELADGANLPELVAALSHKVPALAGSVIHPEEQRLTDSYTFAINGQFYSGEEKVQLKNGEHVALIFIVVGG